MGLLTPTPPPYDALAWEKLPFPEKCRQVCHAWTLQGYGSPTGALALYGIKVALYVAAWLFFCSRTPGMGGIRTIHSWWLTPVAYEKAILWSMLFEGLGLGCGSGPLTGRYFPPIGGVLYFARPGTTKRPLFERLPILGGHQRTPIDVGLYLACQLFLFRALLMPAIGPAELLPIAILIPLLGLADRTVFLAARAEHFYAMLLCFLMTDAWIGPAKAVQLALWFWAGVSKLNPHFPAVVGVMMSNSPVVRSSWLKKRMYRRWPDDLRPSRLAAIMAHAGTALELGVPIVLGLASGGIATKVGLVMMLLLHGFITSSVPMGVPIEWNVIMVYGGFFLFGAHAPAGVLSGLSAAAGSIALYAILAIALIVLPLLGNLRPDLISFLLAMRYYAGNWAYSVWLFRGESYRKLDRLTKSAPWVMDQLARFYDRRTAMGLVSKVLAFRAMHLHGRALHDLIPRAVDRIEDYEYVEGELIAGLVLGWNFGDGHLHDEGLLRAVQAQCGFEAGELRCIFVEAQPLLGSSVAWRIWDANTGLLDQGEIAVRALGDRQPWPAAA